jgi:hypothetical protein
MSDSPIALTDLPSEAWLPPGKTCGVCFTVDDVHPGKSTDAYEAGGDLGRGALGHIKWLLERHPSLWVTLFTTADWQEIDPIPTRRLFKRVPILRNSVMLSPSLVRGTMRIDRHPEFARYLSGLPRTELALHGLHHVHPGLKIFQEFQGESVAQCATKLRWALEILQAAGLNPVPGMTPPGWEAPPNLLAAMAQVGLRFVASARDIKVDVTPAAVASMSGLPGVSLTRPQILTDSQLIHFTTNFQATSPIERARQILDNGGLLAIKGHIVKNARGYVMLDGIDGVYSNFLDLLFSAIERERGESVWWTSMGQITERVDAWRIKQKTRPPDGGAVSGSFAC